MTVHDQLRSLLLSVRRRWRAEGVLDFWMGALEREAGRIEEVGFALGWV